MDVEEIHKEQLKKLKNVTYGGATLEQIFKYNARNDEAIYVTFKAQKNQHFSLKNLIFFIFFPKIVFPLVTNTQPSSNKNTHKTIN